MSTHRKGTCPTCRYSGDFEHLGEQIWPQDVAEKFGLPSTITLWSCPHCLTTISEPDLLPYSGEFGPEDADPYAFPLAHTLPLRPRTRTDEQRACSNQVA